MTLDLLLAIAVVIALNAYVLAGGADFGGGVWDLLAHGGRARAQRELITHAIGPIWEANHVWLILAIVLLFVCFPLAFARLAIALNIPLTLVLFGIVLRGSAFAFRSYGGDRDAVQQRWGRVFAVASLVTPILLGVSFGVVASGHVFVEPMANAGFRVSYIAPWLNAFDLQIGALTLGSFAYLAAVYLTVAADDELLREDFRQRALASGVFVLLAGANPLMILRPAFSIVVLATIAAGASFWSLWTRRYHVARAAAAVQVSLVIWGWAIRQYPYILPPDLTIAASAAPRRTLLLVAGALALGAIVLVPSLVYLFRVFSADTHHMSTSLSTQNTDNM